MFKPQDVLNTKASSASSFSKAWSEGKIKQAPATLDRSPLLSTGHRG